MIDKEGLLEHLNKAFRYIHVPEGCQMNEAQLELRWFLNGVIKTIEEWDGRDELIPKFPAEFERKIVEKFLQAGGK